MVRYSGAMVAMRGAGLVFLILTTMALAGCGPAIGERDDDDPRGGLGVTRESLEVELPTDAQWLSVAVKDELVYVLGQPVDAYAIASPDRHLLAIDRKSGEQRWRADFVLPNTGIAVYATELSVAGDALLFRSDSMIIALSPADGRVLWHIEEPSAQLRYIGAVGDTFYTSTYPDRVTAWSLRDGSEQETWDLQPYIFSGYSGGDLWLTNDGRQIVAIVDPTGQGMEVGVVAIDLQSGGSSPRELMRNTINYSVTETMVGPLTFSSSMTTYGRSDHVARVSTAYDKITLEAWSVLDGEQVWRHEIPIDQAAYYAYSMAYYAPRLLISPHHALIQEPGSEGVLLRNVLRLHLHGTEDFEREWTNVVPTQHYVSSMLELPQDRVLFQTRNDQGTFNERWYAFDARTGRLLWASDDKEFVGSTRAVASDGHTVARLMTTNWTDGRLFLDVL